KGEAFSPETLKDDVFGVSAEKAIRLTRKVGMYQWKEIPNPADKTFRYERTWSEEPIDSTKFNAEGREAWEKKIGGRGQIENPPTKPYDNKTYAAAKATIGAFTLSPDLASKIGPEEPVSLDTLQPPDGFEVRDGAFYKGATPNDPRIGDLKVMFYVVKSGE